MSRQEREVVLGRDDEGRRLDRVARKILPDLSLGSIFKALRRRDIRLNGGRATEDTRVHAGDTVQFRGPIASRVRLMDSTPVDHGAELDSRRILHETRHIIVVNKAAGELAHGPGSLEFAVRALWARRRTDEPDENAGASFRPGPVHRLDRNTSGLIVYALSTEGAREASRAFRERLVHKHYLALLTGVVSAPAVWESRLERDTASGVTRSGSAGKSARTVVEPLLVRGARTLALVTIETGRTHQIRAQAREHGHPLLGDRKYGGGGNGRYVLHACRLVLTDALPALGFTELVAPLPPASVRMLDKEMNDRWRSALAEHGLAGAATAHPGDGHVY